jgi:hypothetical protein
VLTKPVQANNSDQHCSARINLSVSAGQQKRVETNASMNQIFICGAAHASNDHASPLASNVGTWLCSSQELDMLLHTSSVLFEQHSTPGCG